MKAIAPFLSLFLGIAFSLAYAEDADDLLDTSKVRELAKKIVADKHNITKDDLEIGLLVIMFSPDAGFFQVEASVEQISTRRLLTETEIVELMSSVKNTSSHQHYQVTSYSVTFNSKEPDQGSVGKGTTYVSKRKP